jgi:erythromycin esterase
MKTTITTLLLLVTCLLCFSQNTTLSELEKISIDLGDVDGKDNSFNEFHKLEPLLEGVEIVMLGEQSHGDATTFETKVKLIKYLHQNLGFDILAFETGIYDCDKAWKEMNKGADVRQAFGKSVQHIWSTQKELIPLTDYLESTINSDSPLKFMGFDNQHYSKYSYHDLLIDLSEHLEKSAPQILETKEWSHLKNNLELLLNFQTKQVKKNNPELDTVFLNSIVRKLESIDSKDIWIQTLKSIKSFLADVSLKTDFRDRQMADNLIWIKENNPDSKIICWGATSHFLYNSDQVRMKSPIVGLLGANYYRKQDMMGDHIKRKYGDKLFMIGFTTYEGHYGVNRRKKIKPPKEKSLEYKLGQIPSDNFLIPLEGLKLKGLLSRPLAHFYMKNDITQVMDAIIFNRYMRIPILDNNFFLKIYPENKYIKPIPVKQTNGSKEDLKKTNDFF